MSPAVFRPLVLSCAAALLGLAACRNPGTVAGAEPAPAVSPPQMAMVGAHLLDCVRVGVQGGFHAIGDAAIATVLEGFGVAARAVGVDRLREGRHRIEHVELADKAMISVPRALPVYQTLGDLWLDFGDVAEPARLA